MKRADSVYNIAEAVVQTVQCTKCDDLAGTSDGINAENWASYLYSQGWRGTEKHIYCPVCAKTFKLK